MMGRLDGVVGLCPDCRGTGRSAKKSKKTKWMCPTCSGRGHVVMCPTCWETLPCTAEIESGIMDCSYCPREDVGERYERNMVQKLVGERWVPCALRDLKKGDEFRMQFPDGKPLEGLAVDSVFVAAKDPSRAMNENGLNVWGIEAAVKVVKTHADDTAIAAE